ncbi:MAG: ectonucleotide pyrophosphatase/phosphodiesterase [Chitinophagaceae bacterium]
MIKKWLFVFVVFLNHIVAAQHVVLISIDGLRPEMYRDKSWPTPNLQMLMKQGVYANHIKSVFPSFTYPSHTAMLTGALPARSGICYNAASTGSAWNWFTKDIKVPTLWQAIKQNGLTSSAVEWPVSVSDDITYNIPEIWNTKTPEDRITEVRKYATRGLIEEIEEHATGKLNGDNMNEEYLSLDENAGRMAAYIFKTYKPNLLCVHFAEVDGMEHEFGREGDSVRLAVATADHAIGDILEAIERSGMKDSTTVIIVGDHGFSDIHEAIFPNTWLVKKGLHGFFFQPAGGSAFLYLKDPGNKALLDSIRTVLKNLPQATRKKFRIIEKPELIKMGADKDAVMALAAIPGIIFGGAADKESKPVSGGHHGYDPNIPEMYTGFIAAGAGINKGKAIHELCVTDIASLIAKLLGLQFNAPPFLFSCF